MVNPLSETQEDRTWFEDGIVYTEFVHPVNAAAIKAMQNKGLEVLAQTGANHVPYIVIIKGEAQGNMHIGLGDMGKIVSHEFTKHISSIWTVGRTQAHNKITDAINHYFLGNRMHFVDTLEEAQAGARQLIHDTLGLLEQDKD